MEDSEIVALYWSRSENAIQETAEKYGRYCYSIAYRILSNRQEAEEGVNDAYLNAWNSIPPHRPAFLSTFLGKITRYVCLKKWRDQRTKKRGGGEIALVFEELSECLPHSQTIDEELGAKEIAKILNEFLMTLPAEERRVFVCRYWYLDSIADLSHQFNFSQSKIKSMLYRTRNKLMLTLKKEGVF